MDRSGVGRRTGSHSKTCTQCGRTFARLEHLDRHRLTHTQDRPYQCRHCGQRFQRTDVLYRHMSKYCPNVEPEPGTGQQKRSRIRVACLPCRDRKLKCDGKFPCRTCESKGYECHYQKQGQDQQDYQVQQDSGSGLHQQIAPAEASMSSAIPGGLATPASLPGSGAAPSSTKSQSSSIGGMALDSTTQPSAVEKYSLPRPYQDTGPATSAENVPNAEGWNFDWMMDMEMNDFSFFDWMPNESTFELSPHMWGFEYNANNFVPPSVPGPATQAPGSDASTTALKTLKQELGSVYDRVYENEPSIDFWLKQPHVPRKYDLELLNLFLNLFMEYVPATFKSFSNFSITEFTLPEQVLAMSAVGALFSKNESSWRIARTLYGDASRMIVSNGSAPKKPSQAYSLSLAQTHLAFEIFGFCSGHKRSNELTEAFHGHTIQTYVDHEIKSRSDSAEPTSEMLWHRLCGDLFVVECYRICLAQLPPVVRPEMARDFLNQPEQSDSDSSPSYTASLTPFSSGPGRTRSSKSPVAEHDDLHTVAAHSILSWFSLGMWSDSGKPYNGTLWRREVPELSLRKLQIDSDDSNSKPGTSLYHTNILALHSPMELINSFAYSYAHLSDLSTTTIAILRQWQKDEDCDIACWHASQIRRIARQRMQLGDKASNEAPHDALCVFLATLVGWCADIVSADRGPHATTALEEGIEGMRTYRVRVKTFLIGILESLLQNTEEEFGSPEVSTSL